MDFLDNIRSALAEYKMIEKGDAVVAALSGGADSVSLLHALTELSGELGITVSACHVNHHLRGAESDADMHFCEEFCGRLGVELRVLEVDVASMQRKHESLEECARRVRYDFFAEVSEGKKLATAHNSNDCAETVLLNLMRGTGLKGLCGVPPVRGNIIRPLIFCTREEVEEWKEKRDPIKLFRAYLTRHKLATKQELDDIEAAAAKKMEAAVEFAMNSPEPDPAHVLDDVFYEG